VFNDEFCSGFGEPSEELAQHLSNPGNQHWKALDRLMGCVKAKKFDGLIYRKPKELRATLFVDSDYAKDLDSSKEHIFRTAYNWRNTCELGIENPACCYAFVHGSRVYQFGKGCVRKQVCHYAYGQSHAVSKGREIYKDNLGAIYLVKNQHVGSRDKTYWCKGAYHSRA
jgi:hypothetical protein